MRFFFDTSVLVPVFLGEHEHHSASQDVFVGMGRNRGFCSAHTLVEFYSTLTRMPPRERVPADRAMQFVQEIASRLEVISLDVSEYVQAITAFVEAGIIGGAAYDGLHARCAMKAKADIIYTWNVRDFERLGPEIARRLRVPGGEATSP